MSLEDSPSKDRTPSNVSFMERLSWLFIEQPGISSSGIITLYLVIFGTLLLFGPAANRGGYLQIAGVAALWVLAEVAVKTRYGPKPPLNIAAMLVTVTLGLIGAIIWLDSSKTSIFLFVLVPQRVFRYFGELAGFVSALAAWVFFATLSYLYSSNLQNYLFNLLMWTIALVFLSGRSQSRLRQEAHRAQTEKLLRELEISHAQLKEYSLRVEGLATMEERNRIAREIHDSLGHYLTAISIQLESMAVLLEHEPAEASHVLEDTRRLAKEALQDVRRSVGTLRDNPEIFSIEQALPELLEQVGKRASFRLSLKLEGSARQFSNQAQLTLYRVIQEALTNIQKYADAHQVNISLQFKEDEAALEIADDGRGFDPLILQKLAPGRLHGYGLVGARERVELLGGYFKLDSAPGAGTKLAVVVPRKAFGRSGVAPYPPQVPSKAETF